MRIVVSWSNGMQSELEVAVPEGATALRTSFSAPAPPTALHQQGDGSWSCWQKGPRVLLGYCQPEWMMGRSLCGPTWAEAKADPAIARCLPHYDEAWWDFDRALRVTNGLKFHFHGHATDQAAIDCYREFLMDFGEKEVG